MGQITLLYIYLKAFFDYCDFYNWIFNSSASGQNEVQWDIKTGDNNESWQICFWCNQWKGKSIKIGHKNIMEKYIFSQNVSSKSEKTKHPKQCFVIMLKIIKYTVGFK